LKQYNVEVLVCEGELSNERDVQSIIDFVFEKTDGVDILYNNAAVMSKADKIWKIPMEEWRRVFDINLFAVVKLCSAFAPEMRKRKWGRIINLSSGIKDQPDLSPYSVSKAAIDKFTKDLAWEYKDDNVLINYLDPGWLKTDLGGPNADNEVDTVLYGAIVPALLEDNGPTGRGYSAQDFKYLK
jgi:NAD(P)-dependent dehydrogenase (short-subunit alcohol dehydrogenase family)